MATRYDLWKESGPVDALTDAERESCAYCGEPVDEHADNCTENIIDEGPNPDDAYDRMRLGE